MLDASEALGDAATDIVMSKLLPNAEQLPSYGVDEEFTNQIDGLETTVTKLRIAQSSTPPKITSLQISQRVDSNGDLPPSIEAKKFENFSVKAVGAANTNP